MGFLDDGNMRENMIMAGVEERSDLLGAALSVEVLARLICEGNDKYEEEKRAKGNNIMNLEAAMAVELNGSYS